MRVVEAGTEEEEAAAETRGMVLPEGRLMERWWLTQGSGACLGRAPWPAPAWASCPRSQQESLGPQHPGRVSASSSLPCHRKSLTRNGASAGAGGLDGDQDRGLLGPRAKDYAAHILS